MLVPFELSHAFSPIFVGFELLAQDSIINRVKYHFLRPVSLLLSRSMKNLCAMIRVVIGPGFPDEVLIALPTRTLLWAFTEAMIHAFDFAWALCLGGITTA